MRNRILAISVSILVLYTTSLTAQSLPAGEWRLESYKFKRKVEFPIDKSEITMNVHENGKLGGKSGCNVYGGSFAFESGKLKISDLISTMMACEEPTMQFERSYNETLSGASVYSMKDGVLTLTDPKTGNYLRFKLFEKNTK